jgi:hypothetical protein
MGKIARGRVAALEIVESFDELKNGHPHLAVTSEATPIDQLALEGERRNSRGGALS